MTYILYNHAKKGLRVKNQSQIMPGPVCFMLSWVPAGQSLVTIDRRHTNSIKFLDICKEIEYYAHFIHIEHQIM
jgi:hypothetical protein